MKFATRWGCARGERVHRVGARKTPPSPPSRHAHRRSARRMRSTMPPPPVTAGARRETQRQGVLRRQTMKVAPKSVRRVVKMRRLPPCSSANSTSAPRSSRSSCAAWSDAAPAAGQRVDIRSTFHVARDPQKPLLQLSWTTGGRYDASRRFTSSLSETGSARTSWTRGFR